MLRGSGGSPPGAAGLHGEVSDPAERPPRVCPCPRAVLRGVQGEVSHLRALRAEAGREDADGHRPALWLADPGACGQVRVLHQGWGPARFQPTTSPCSAPLRCLLAPGRGFSTHRACPAAGDGCWPVCHSFFSFFLLQRETGFRACWED